MINFSSCFSPRKWRMTTRFLVFFLALVLMPSLLLSIWVYERMTLSLREERLTAASRNLNNLEFSISATMTKALSAVSIIRTNPTVSSFLTSLDEEKSWGQQYDDYRNLLDLINNYSDNDDIYRIRFWISSEQFYTVQNIYFCDLQELETMSLMAELQNKGHTWYFWGNRRDSLYSDNQPQISLLTNLTARGRTGAINTVVFEVDFLVSSLRRLLLLHYLPDGSRIHMVDKDGNIVCSSDDNYLGSNISAKMKTNQIVGIGVDEQANAYWIVQPMSVNNWSIIVEGTVTGVLGANTSLQLVLFSLLSVTVLGLIATGVFFAFIRKRLQLLERRMDRITEYDKLPLSEDVNEDEIGHLNSYFNQMVNRIRLMIDEIQSINRQKRETEINLLLSQINPHFLYNTLEAINWKILDLQAYPLSKSISLLSRYLRLSLSGHHHLVTIDQELTMVELYLQLQQNLVGKRLKWDIEVPEALMKHLMPKFILQPLVENAILHGVTQSAAQEGWIRIVFKPVDERLEIMVCDDGPGMDTDQLIKIRNSLTMPDHGNFSALNNVNQRLIQQYGQSAGLLLSSSPNQETCVRFAIPLCLSQDNSDISG